MAERDNTEGDVLPGRDGEGEEETSGQGGEAVVGEEAVSLEQMLKTLEVVKAIAGYENSMVLDVLFQAFGELIKEYRLSECDALLSEAREAIEARGKEDKYCVQLVQALAFLRFKQFRFAEAVEHFEEMRLVVGPNAFLLENTGHAYNSLGDQASAERCFSEALALIDAAQEAALGTLLEAKPELEGSVSARDLEVPEAANRGGLLMGLGLVLHRTERSEEGLVLLQEARAYYEARAARASPARVGDERVLVAKAAVSVAGALTALSRLEEAAQSYSEAVEVFSSECGLVNPLTADALRKLGLVLVQLAREKEAEATLSQALELSVAVDTFSVNVYNLAELVITLFQLHGRLGVYEARAAWYVPLLSTALEKIRKQGNEKAVASGEFLILSKLAEELATIAAAYASSSKSHGEGKEQELTAGVGRLSMQDDEAH